MSGDNPIHNLFKGLSDAMTEGQLPGKDDWWQSFRFPETPDFSVEKLMNCARSALFGRAMMGGAAVHEASFMGIIPRDLPIEDVAARIQHYVTELNGRLIYNLESEKFFFVFSGGAILAVIDFGGLGLDIEIVGTTKSHLQMAEDMLNTCIKGKDEQVETE